MIKSAITECEPADSQSAIAHFSSKFRFETDCWDVHDAMTTGKQDFILVDVRSPAMYAKKHVPGAINIPHGKMIKSRMSVFPEGTVFVVYCAGPHCNGSTKAALRLAQLGLKVKEMIGGITGWADEGFDFASGETIVGSSAAA